MADRFLPLAEDWKPGMRLGRHVRHDARSLLYKVQPTGVVQTKIWERKIPILDQGNLGSCTGNATVGALGTEGLYEHLTPVQRKALTEDEAVRIYSLGTTLDDFPGAYKPTDTGCDGLSVAKAAQRLGYLSGYQHITSVAAAQTAIVQAPFIVGTNWYSGMDNPDSSGLVHVTGSVRGGHEYCCFGYDTKADRWWFANSWGQFWGKDGTFSYSSADFAKLLAQQGDATTFVPINQPAPVPTPTPVPPIPTPTPLGFPLAKVDPWLEHTHTFSTVEKVAKQAVKDWLAS